MSETIKGRVARRQSEADRQNASFENIIRSNKYGDLGVFPFWGGLLGAAYAGALFTFCNATPGTAVATTTSIATFDATKPTLIIYNTETDPNGKEIVLLSYMERITQVPTSATEWEFAWVMDVNDRRSSAGTAVTPTNCHSGTVNTTVARIHQGAPIAAAASASVRIHSRGIIREQVPVTLDSTNFVFGGQAGASIAMSTLVGVSQTIALAPLVIAPGHCAILYEWGTSNAAAPSWEFCGLYAEV